eukprot:366301-Chlamydomonas_euryale.AAC.55
MAGCRCTEQQVDAVAAAAALATAAAAVLAAAAAVAISAAGAPAVGAGLPGRAPDMPTHAGLRRLPRPGCSKAAARPSAKLAALRLPSLRAAPTPRLPACRWTPSHRAPVHVRACTAHCCQCPAQALPVAETREERLAAKAERLAAKAGPAALWSRGAALRVASRTAHMQNHTPCRCRCQSSCHTSFHRADPSDVACEPAAPALRPSGAAPSEGANTGMSAGVAAGVTTPAAWGEPFASPVVRMVDGGEASAAAWGLPRRPRGSSGERVWRLKAARLLLSRSSTASGKSDCVHTIAPSSSTGPAAAAAPTTVSVWLHSNDAGVAPFDASSTGDAMLGVPWRENGNGTAASVVAASVAGVPAAALVLWLMHTAAAAATAAAAGTTADAAGVWPFAVTEGTLVCVCGRPQHALAGGLDAPASTFRAARKARGTSRESSSSSPPALSPCSHGGTDPPALRPPEPPSPLASSARAMSMTTGRGSIPCGTMRSSLRHRSNISCGLRRNACRRLSFSWPSTYASASLRARAGRDRHAADSAARRYT